MISRTPDEIKSKYGALFSRRFLVMVDSNAGLAEIIEQCHARGPIEWDAMNRIRARGCHYLCEGGRDHHDHAGPAWVVQGELWGSAVRISGDSHWKE